MSNKCVVITLLLTISPYLILVELIRGGRNRCSMRQLRGLNGHHSVAGRVAGVQVRRSVHVRRLQSALVRTQRCGKRTGCGESGMRGERNNTISEFWCSAREIDTFTRKTEKSKRKQTEKTTTSPDTIPRVSNHQQITTQLILSLFGLIFAWFYICCFNLVEIAQAIWKEQRKKTTCCKVCVCVYFLYCVIMCLCDLVGSFVRVCVYVPLLC